MNVILLSASEVKEGRAILRDHRAKHIIKILRSDVGCIIKIGIINDKLGEGRVTALKKKFPFEVELETELTTSPPPKSPIDLLLAMPRPIMLRRIFSQAATLGIKNIHIVNANRVEKSFWNSGLIEEAEYREHLLHGLEQAVDTVLPGVFFHRRFRPFVENYFPTIAKQYSTLMYAHPSGEQQLHHIIMPEAGKIFVAIGPEGGWVKYEEDRFREHGFSGFTLGPRILKVDTAVVNIHGRIMAELDRIS